MDISRRSFVGSSVALGAAAIAVNAGIALADDAVVSEKNDKAVEGAVSNFGTTDAAGYAEDPTDFASNKGAGLPWSGPGSVTGDWNGTPEDVKRLGGCTMPLDELNRRRQMYVDAATEYTKADGTKVPLVYSKVRALLHTYGWGVGNHLTDTCFDWIMKEIPEDEAQAYLEMPRGRKFTAAEFARVSGRTVEECTEICEDLFSKVWLGRYNNDEGTLYMQIAFIQGVGELHTPELYSGETSFDDMLNIMADDGLSSALMHHGDIFFSVKPCSKDVVKDGDIDPRDDLFAIWATKNKYSLSPCFCRSVNNRENLPDLPGYPGDDWETKDLEGATAPICGHDMLTCLSCGEEAQFWIDHGVGREITREEALARLQKSVDEGMILQSTNSTNNETICSCHGDCCLVMLSWQALGEDGSVARGWQNRSHYNLEFTEDTCAKCGACAERCPMHTITMDEKTGLPVVGGMCMSCGQCAYVCPTQSRALVRKPDEEMPYVVTDIPEQNNYIAAGRFEDGLIW